MQEKNLFNQVGSYMVEIRQDGRNSQKHKHRNVKVILCQYLSGVVVVEVEQRLTEGFGHLFKVLSGEVCLVLGAQGRAGERRLHGVAIGDAHHPHHHPSSPLFRLLDPELAALEGKLQNPDQTGPPQRPSLTLSAVFLCSISGNTCSCSFLSAPLRFSQP